VLSWKRIVVDVYVIFNNMKIVSVAMEMQQLVPFALLSSCKIFRTAAKKMEVLRS
jgi:hypothetical protein